MLAANLPYIVNILIFIGYFVFWRDRTAWPEHFVLWPWLIYIVHVCLHHFADSLQNTTRNVARIYLIRQHGPNYDSRLVVPIQTALVPNSMLPIIFLWITAHVGSFAALLFVQGWVAALVAEFGLMILGCFIPLRYPGHLRRVREYAANLNSKASFALMVAGISPQGLADVADQALQEGRNPQEWWGAVLREALENEMKEEITNKAIDGD